LTALRQRGFTFIGFLILVGAAAAIFGAITYGPVYIENFEVNSILHETANYCYRQTSDELVKDYFMSRMSSSFMVDVMERGRMEHVFKFEVDREELRIERTEIPLAANVWFTYRRTVRFPLVGGEREVVFVGHASQDLTPVKW